MYTFVIERKTKFQLEVSANKSVVSFPFKFIDPPLKSGPQARNSWPKQKQYEKALKYMQLLLSHDNISVYMVKPA